ncbi:MAG: hypothetical protein JWM80_2482 [Cyanobacteria bacterium RYN_339]|nr:hypothetical protein [Cyanobacteria bacterium RYN_339]
MRSFQSLTIALCTAVLAGCGSAGNPTSAPELLSDVAAAPVVAVTQPVEAVTQPVDSDEPLAQLPEPTVRAEGDIAASNILDPWRPMAFTASHTDHNAVTLTWRTELESRAMVYFGKSTGFETHGFTNVQAEDIKRKSHTLRIEGLSRYTKYRFLVVGLGPVGLQFPSSSLDVRTKLIF